MGDAGRQLAHRRQAAGKVKLLLRPLFLLLGALALGGAALIAGLAWLAGEPSTPQAPPDPAGTATARALASSDALAIEGARTDSGGSAERRAVASGDRGAPAALGGTQVDAAEFCALVHLWDTLKLDKIQQGKRGTGYLPAFTLALVRQRSSAATA